MKKYLGAMHRFFAGILILMSIAACNKQSLIGVDNNVEPTLSSIQQNIFTPSCALPGCHAGNNPAQGLSLEAGRSFNELVNNRSSETNFDLVEPNNANASYLFRKVLGQGIVGSRMPLGRGELIRAQTDAIRDWIEDGAPNN